MSARTEHESFVQPNNQDILIWRYMDLSKYLDILCSSRLYFPRADCLGDPFEGSIAKFNVATRLSLLERRRTDPSVDVYEGMTDDAVRQMYQQVSEFNEKAVKSYFVSCWHMNEQESAAMWKLYSKSDESICICAAYSKLVSMMSEYVFAGIVNYIDYSKQMIPEGNLLNAIMHKRKSFEHEREIRFVIWAFSHNTPKAESSLLSGRSVDIDVNQMIDCVFVNPAAPDWFSNLVQFLSSRLGGTFPVRKSSLLETPIY